MEAGIADHNLDTARNPRRGCAMDELLYEVGLYYSVVAQSSEIFGAQMVGRRDSQLIALVTRGCVDRCPKGRLVGSNPVR